MAPPNARTTPVFTEFFDESPMIAVPIPDGYYRVWEGTVQSGDLFLHAMQFINYRRVEWSLPNTVGEPVFEYLAVVRIGSSEFGRSCQSCGMRCRDSVGDPEDWEDAPCAICLFCLHNLPDEMFEDRNDE